MTVLLQRLCRSKDAAAKPLSRALRQPTAQRLVDLQAYRRHRSYEGGERLRDLTEIKLPRAETAILST
jgi:hypothetical protein